MKNLVLNLRNAKAQAGCAESTHTSLSFRKGLGVGLTCLLLTLGVGQTWGADVQKNAIIYMNNATSNWTYSNIYFCINDDYGYEMSPVTNTKLLVHKRTDNTWGGYSYIRFFGANGSWGNPASLGGYSNMYDYGANLSNTYNNYGFNANNYYVIKLSKTGTKDSQASLSISNPGSTISSMNKMMTIKAKISTDGGSSYSQGNTPGELTADSYEFTAYNSCSSATSATVSAGSASSTLSVGYTANLTLEAADVEGYDFIGWSSGTNASTNIGTTKSVTVNPTAATTYYAWYREKRHQIKALTPSPSAGGSSNSPSSWTYAGEITGGSISVSTNTGYDFTGWTISSGSGTFANASATSTTFYPTADSELRPNFTTKTITVTLDGNEGTGGTATVKYNASSLTSITHATRAGYSLEGYFTASSGGYKVISADGSLNNVSGWVSGGYWIKATNGTLYAQWTESAVYYTLNFTYGTSSTGYVTVTAKNSSTEAAISYGASLLSGTGVTVTAAPEAHYKFVGWYSNAACTSSVSTDNPYSFTISANTSLYAKVERMTTTVTFNKNGGSGSTPATLTATHGSNSLSSGYVAPTRTGYTFNGWYDAESGGNKVFGTNGVITSSSGYADGSGNWTYTGSTLTVYAQWTEKTSTLTTSNHYDSGDPSYAAPTKSASSIGISTTATVTASSAGTGYTFAGWTLTNCVRTDGGGATANPITVRSNGDGAAATVVANYEEVLTSTYYVEGDASGPFTQGWNANASTMMMKRSGSASSSDVYWTVDVPAAKTSPGDTQWEFKIYNSAGANDNAKWLGWGTGGDFYWLTKANHSLTLSTSGSNNIRFKPYVEGTYTFHVNYSTPASPTLEVIWPVVNQLRISAASPADATNTNNFDLSDQGSNNWSVTRTLNAKTTYTFKMVYDGEWYGKNSTALTRASNTASSLSNSGADMTIQTDAEGSYTFTFNSSTKNLTVTYPAAHTITFGAGNHNGSNSAITATASPSFSSGDYVLDATSVTFNKGTTKTGYTWDGWYSKSDGTGTKHSATDGSWTSSSRDANLSVYACYNLVTYTITYNLNGGSNPVSPAPATSYNIESAAITLPTPTKTGYTFNGWYTNEALTAGPVTTISTGSTGNKTYWAKWTPKQTTITLNNQDATTPGTTEVTATYDAAMPAITLPTKTGYTFGGYWGAPGGSGPQYYNADGSSTQNWDNENSTYTLFAKWIPKQSVLTFDYQLSTEGHGNAGTLSSVTATYDAAMPALTGNMPTAAEGYAFMGFFSETGGNGTKYYNADKSSAHNWDIDTESGTTLYAYYKKAEITGITFSPAAAEPGDEVTATAAISPTPSGTTTVCWEVRYASNDIPLSPQPTLTPASGASVTFNAPPAAVYKFIATLKTGNDCSGGTILDTENANLTVAGSHPVTIRYKHGDVVIKEETIQNIHATVATEISAPNIIGYSFSSWTLGDGITKVSGNLTDPSITVTAIYDGVITANYNPKRMIYFYNTLGWSNVVVNFYRNDKYWGYGGDEGKGTGSNPSWTKDAIAPFIKNGNMTQIAGTNIWYYDCEANSVSADVVNVAFTEYKQDNYNYFSYKYGTSTPNKVARRGDYHSTMPMFVPVEQDGVSMNGGQAIYYNEGYWMNYPENTGYKVKIYNWYEDTEPAREYYFPYSSDKKMPLKLDVEFNTTDAKWFSIYRNDGVYLSVNAVMTQASHTNYRIKASSDKIKIQPSATGIYTYTLTFYDDGEKDGSGKAYGNMYHITVDYPVSVGDYRIMYSDNAEWSQGTVHTASWNHPSDAINKISGEATEAKKDTVSLFVSYGASATAKFQYVTAINPTTGAVTWADVDGGTISLSSITKSGTYNFIVTQPVGGASVSVEKIEAYTGNYYIRTDCAGNTKWDNYRAADHQMTYSEFSCSEANSFGEKFSHYFTHWCPAGMNVKFVIANDYSSCISDTLIQDVGNTYANINSDGFLNSDGSTEETANRFSANIRFMYHEATNKISRAYVASSTNEARWFLVLRSNSAIHGQDDKPIEDIGSGKPSVILDDKQNWIYEQTLKIKPGSKFKLFACYADVTPTEERAQYFRGNYASNDWSNSANTIELVGGTGDYQKVRVLYDFKTNRLVCAWLPSGDISGEIDINADVMIIREHQEDATMITFATSSSKLTDVKTVYGTMKFDRWTLNNKSSADGHAVLPLESQKSIFERALYFISFPFDVNLGEVFGFGTYGVHWIIENYDGENRAKNGYWIDSEPNWKYVMSPKGYTLKANKGYILCLDLDQMKDDNEEFWPHGINTVELFFPSAVAQSTIEQNNVTIPAPDPAIYQCTINRPGPDGDRRVKDSYWRCLGVPSFANYTTTLSDGTSTITWQTADNTLPYLYVWNMEDNTLSAQSTSTFAFKTMHAYLTQCSTQIIWTAASKPTPSSIVARRAEDEQISNIEFRLELAENEVKADQAYVRFSTREDVTSGFEFGNDLSKEMNVNKSNIYTLIGSERAAANSLPLSTEQTTIIPVGVLANTAGDYTFSIPDGTDGIGVTLIDNETGIHTQLGALDYTVTLDKGTYESRFYLEISPIHGTPTDVGEVRGERLEVRGVRKVIIDQNMYIIRDGKMYDARGARVE